MNGPPESVARGRAPVMVPLDDGADLGSSVMAVCSIFELRRQDALHDISWMIIDGWSQIRSHHGMIGRGRGWAGGE